MSTPKTRCEWCGKMRNAWSGWEQKELRKIRWIRLCVPCLNRRLRNPANALLEMRKAK